MTVWETRVFTLCVCGGGGVPFKRENKHLPIDLLGPASFSCLSSLASWTVVSRSMENSSGGIACPKSDLFAETAVNFAGSLGHLDTISQVRLWVTL